MRRPIIAIKGLVTVFVLSVRWIKATKAYLPPLSSLIRTPFQGTLTGANCDGDFLVFTYAIEQM